MSHSVNSTITSVLLILYILQNNSKRDELFVLLRNLIFDRVC